MIKSAALVLIVFVQALHADGVADSCQAQLQRAAERALQDLPEGNLRQGLEAFSRMMTIPMPVTVIASEKKGRDAQDEAAEELSKRVVAFLDVASPYYLGVGDTGQDLKVPKASQMGRLLREPEFLRKFWEELESPDFDGTGYMSMSIKVKAGFVRNYLVSEKKMGEHQSLPIFIDTTPDTVMRQGFYVVLNERGVTFPKIIQKLENLARKWRSQNVPVHFVIRANLIVVKPFVHESEVAMDIAQGHPFDLQPGYLPLKGTHFDQVTTFGASPTLYILAIPQPLKPL